jgi:hypothetical protein
MHQHGRQLADRGAVQLGKGRVGQPHHDGPAPDPLGGHAALEDVKGADDVGAARGEPGRPAHPQGAGPVGRDVAAPGDHDAAPPLGRRHRPQPLGVDQDGQRQPGLQLLVVRSVGDQRDRPHDLVDGVGVDVGEPDPAGRPVGTSQVG